MGAGHSNGQTNSAHRSGSCSSSGNSKQAASEIGNDAQTENSVQADQAAGVQATPSQLDLPASQQPKVRPGNGVDRSQNSKTEEMSPGGEGTGRHGRAEDSVAKQHENAQEGESVPSHTASLQEQQQRQASMSAQSWSDPSALQYLHEHSAMGSRDLGKRLQLPEGFETIHQAEEERLVMAGCQSTDMLCLFRAYAAHDSLTFIKFARLCHYKALK